MPTVRNHRRIYVSLDGELLGDGAIVTVTGSTLGEALADYTRETGVVLTPFEPTEDSEVPPGKYFLHDGGDRFDPAVVDIHVVRGGEEICPKQDLGFVLMPSDEIHLLGLVC